MRVLYLQLPVLDFGYDYWGADHPLAGGYMAANCMARGLDHEAIFLPRGLTSFGSTPALEKRVLDIDPDVVVATLYLWNVERTCSVLRRLKAEKPSVLILAGGPETAGDFHKRFPDHPFDVVFQGEGEEVLWHILSHLGYRRKKKARVPKKITHALPLDLAKMASPYLMGLLDLAPDGSLWIETMRGCPFRCAYCYYGKSFKKMRWFPEEWIREHLRWGHDRGAKEVYFLDPSFQVSPQLRERVKKISFWNGGKLPLHTEAKVEFIDPFLADQFKEAGFRSVETGLQAVNPWVLKKIGRKGNPGRFAKGAHLLLERGVKLQIDVILGLPGDGIEGFLSTLEFLRREGLKDWVTVFPLLVLPGTRLREKAALWGVEFDPRPPYQVRKVGDLDVDGMRMALEEAERILEVGIYPLHLPDFSANSEPQDGLLSLIEVLGEPTQRVGLEAEDLARLAQAPVFLFREGTDGPMWEEVRKWAKWQRDTIPDLMPFWAIEANQPFSLEELTRVLPDLHEPDSYQARNWKVAPDPYLRMSSRPCIISRCKGPPQFWLEVHQHWVPVIRVSEDPPFPKPDDPLKGLPVLWDTFKKVPRTILRSLARVFQGREEELLFSTRDNLTTWAEVVGLQVPLTKPAFARLTVP